jgi:uncharacterized protein (DUF427 family)
MSLTIGTGPLSRQPAPTNFHRDGPASALYLHPSPRWVRGYVGDQLVVSSTRAALLHESGHLPVYYFPREDVRADLLEDSDTHTHCPYKGDASYHHLRVGDRLIEDAVWYYPEPLDAAPWLQGLVAFYFGKLDRWMEEEEVIAIHPRDPFHRIDTLSTSRRVRVSLDGVELADSTRARALFETGLPTRWYLPAEDVRRELLVPSERHTGCAYKGIARYWSVQLPDRVEENVVWSYPEPWRDGEPVRDLLCFFNEHVDLEIDGQPEERPQTQWSHRR